MYLNSGTRLLVSLLATEAATMCGALAETMTQISTRAKECKLNRPKGGFTAFAGEELAKFSERSDLERRIILHLLERHSTRSGVIHELEAAITFLNGGAAMDSLAKAIEDTFKEITAKKEKVSRIAALGYNVESDD